MCGLVGVAGNLAYKDEGLLKKLLIFDYLRGPDSTGLAAVTMNEEFKIGKVSSSPLDLFQMDSFKRALSAANSKAFIGHNRAATRGVVNTFNAHPFAVDHIVGAHNGTLDWSATDRLEKALGEKFPVDSLAIMHGIAKLGIEETIGMLSGAWALTWYDRKEGTFNMLRNKERPLWYSFDDKFERLIWASEYPIIQAAVHIGKKEHELYSQPKTGYQYFNTDIDTHYSIHLSALIGGGKERPKFMAKELKGRATPVYNPGSTGGGAKQESDPFRMGRSETLTTGGTQTGSGGTGRSNKEKEKEGAAQKVICLVGTPTQPLGGFINEAEFNKMAKYGCSFCQADVEWGDKNILIVERDEAVFCGSCSGVRGGPKIYSVDPNYF